MTDDAVGADDETSHRRGQPGLGEALGLDIAGLDRVHADAARARSWAAVARENASCACFDAAYGPDCGNGDRARDRDDVDDVGGRSRFEAGQERPQAPDAAEVVRPHHVLDPLRVAGEEVVAPREPALFTSRWMRGMTLEDACGTSSTACSIGDVADLELAADLLGERPQSVFAAREQHAVPPSLRERARELCTDAGGGAGDDRDPFRYR